MELQMQAKTELEQQAKAQEADSYNQPRDEELSKPEEASGGQVRKLSRFKQRLKEKREK